MNKNIRFLTSIFFITCTITGCSQGHINFDSIPRITDPNTVNKTIGTLIAYSGFGGVYGQQVTVLAVLATNHTIKGISQYLDEQEKQEAIDAANESLKNPRNNTVSWNSQQTRGETTASTTHGNCREVKQTVFKNGKKYNATSTFCKDLNSGKMVPV